MKAIVQTQYGSPEVLQLVDVEKPDPADNEVLVRIHATTVTATEAVFRQANHTFHGCSPDCVSRESRHWARNWLVRSLRWARM